MLFVISLFGWILLQLVSPAPQINMELTEWGNSTKNNLVFQHDCLRVVASIQKETDPFQIISYCLTELPSTWSIQPNTLVILALPRLIISFASGCMKSGNDAWLFAAGYFISFIPTALNFMVFVMPSKVYKQEFVKAIQQYRQKLQRRVHPTF